MNQVIEFTRDYAIFNTITGNRDTQPAHVKKIMTAIEEDPETIKFNPIIVNERMEVIDGQHRLTAIRELAKKGLNIPVHYIVAPGRTLHDVQKINSGRKAWTPMDFAKSYRELGNSNYARYLDLKKAFGINHDVLLNYLSIGETVNTATMFREGNLKVDDYVASFELCKYLHQFSYHYNNWHRRPFALAIRELWEAPSIDNEQLFDRVKRYGNDFTHPELNLVDYPTPREYIIRLVDIYNFKRKNRYAHKIS